MHVTPVVGGTRLLSLHGLHMVAATVSLGELTVHGRCRGRVAKTPDSGRKGCRVRILAQAPIYYETLLYDSVRSDQSL